MPRTRKTLFATCLAIFIISIVVIIWRANQSWLVSVPTGGGEYTEGLIGTPRFINPLLAASAVDRDLTTLIYSGLLRARTDNNGFIPDLAESYSVSPDGLIYEIKLKENLIWQDGEPVTSDDIIFTISKAKDPILKSPRRANWEGVEVEKTDDHHIVFKLRQPYALFLENLTMGILPAHRWKNLGSEVFPFADLNREPIGTGPYQISKIKRDRDNLPISYTLTPFKDFALGTPKISKLNMRFYPNEDLLLEAYTRTEIEAANSIDPQIINQLNVLGGKVATTTLPRVFGVFFNQNQAKIFTHSAVRKALNAVIDRQAIIDEIFHGHARALTGPLLTDTEETTTGIEMATNLLNKEGWVKNKETGIWELPSKKKGEAPLILQFEIKTSDAPELKLVAEKVKSDWEKLGARVEVKVFELGALNQSVIRPRDYEALLFGEVIGRNPDIYSFWHSTQRLDPGLNIAMYTNVAVDKIIDGIRVANTVDRQLAGYQAFEEEIRRDQPAVFLYAPNFIYIVPQDIQAIDLGTINTPSERFLNVYKWYIRTDQVWPIFSND